MLKLGTFYGVGVGPGDPELLTLKSVRILRDVDYIFEVIGERSHKSVSGSIVDSVDRIKGERIQLLFSMSTDWKKRWRVIKKNAALILEKLKLGKSCAFCTIGDPLTYSTFTYLLTVIREDYPTLNVETIPGITSYQFAASRFNMPLLEDEESLCIIPGFVDDISIYPVDNANTLVFMKAFNNREKIITFLKERGWDKNTIYAAYLGMENEFITTDIDEVLKRPKEYLSLLIVKK
jgi:precorrin-2/cobalt-factor-2 C20-methyltransferase